MKLEFVKLMVAGFRSFNDKATIYFDPGLHYIQGKNEDEPSLGPNGAGKSSLWDALVWCLYGKTLRNLRNPDVIPWAGNKETKVTVTLKLDGDEQKITRTIHPNNLTLNGKKVGNDDVVKLIGIEFEIFGHAVLLAQGQPLFFDKTPSEKMQVLSDVLHLEKWEARSKQASERTRELDDKLIALQGQKDGTEIQYTDAKKSIVRMRALVEGWDQDQAKKMDSSDAELKDYEAQLGKLVKGWAEAELAYDSAGSEVKALAKQLQDNFDVDRQARVDLEVAQAELSRCRQDLKAMKSNKVCPTCGQPIKTDQKALAKLRLIIERGLPDALGEACEAAHAKLVGTRKDLLLFKKKEDEAGAMLDRLRPRKAELDMKIAWIKKNRVENKAELNPYLDELNLLRKTRTKLAGKLDDLGIALESTNKALERTKYWVKGFKDVRLFIVEELLAELEIVTNTMLDSVGLVDWSVAYSVEKETKAGGYSRGLNVVIKSPRNVEPVKWEVWSGGEAQRLRLIGSLALAEVLLNEANVHTNLEILDEPSRGMAAGGIDDLINTLSDRSEQTGKCILFVDHHLVRSTRFDSIIQIVKDKNGSHIHG